MQQMTFYSTQYIGCAMGLIDLTGQRFGRLVVIEHIEHSDKHHTKWKCKCDCGNEVTVIGSHLKDGHTQSCGCLQRDLLKLKVTVHGMYKHPLYGVWKGIHQRCHNPNSTIYQYYGGKGIKICDEWDTDFLSFYTWAIAKGWKKGFDIDRIDSNGDYEPCNCQLLTHAENVAKANRERSNIYDKT